VNFASGCPNGLLDLMKPKIKIILLIACAALIASVVWLARTVLNAPVAGLEKTSSASQTGPQIKGGVGLAATNAATNLVSANAASPEVKSSLPVIRIRAGANTPFKDSNGQTLQHDKLCTAVARR
jgi:hypothetical protein